MPDLPQPEGRRPDDGLAGLVTQLVPTLVSLVALGAMGMSLGHPGLTLLLVAGAGIAAAAQLDLHLRRRQRERERLRSAYGAVLASLAPAADWEVPAMDGVDPVCRVLAARAADRLRRVAAVPAPGRSLEPGWASGDDGLRVELAPGVWLDLDEAARGGMGPHGVVVGATGAGKSELLRTLVLGLALRLPPERLTVLGIDFKGGTALAGLAGLPHVVGLVTNLESSPRSVDRLRRALDEEVDRRQGLLRDGAAMAQLVLVVDEFSELLTQHPALLEVLTRIGRLGRSLGMHLVLASQRLDEARLRELDSHLSWRLALRTFTEGDSRAVLGRPDAAALPAEPGWALLTAGPRGPLCRFRVQAFTGEESQLALAAITRRRASPARALWLPPLTRSPRLADLLATAPGIPIGLSDHPVRRTVVTLPVDPGHVAVVGGPGSGKSTLLTTLAQGFGARTDRTVVALDARRPDPDLVLRMPADPCVVVVDDWGVLRTEHPLLEDALVRTVMRDPAVSLVLSASRWADLRPALRDLLGTRIELRLPDPVDSLVDRRLAVDVPPRAPGQGVIDLGAGAERFLAAVPHPDPPRC